ncbi:MAG: hypothetical protein KDJ37_13280 [Hyphomicrobiaceae bacterium]|nr:hypothetical protein [Hyphomicrobiaceae bacterium]
MIWRGVRAGLFIALLGPPIGGLVMVAVMTVAQFGSEAGASSTQPFWLDLLQITYFIAIFSYLFGAIHSILSGIWLGRKVARDGTFSFREAIMTTLVVSVIAGLPYVAKSGVIIVLLQTVSALWAAIACRWLLQRFGWIATIETPLVPSPAPSP